MGGDLLITQDMPVQYCSNMPMYDGNRNAAYIFRREIGGGWLQISTINQTVFQYCHDEGWCAAALITGIREVKVKGNTMAVYSENDDDFDSDYLERNIFIYRYSEDDGSVLPLQVPIHLENRVKAMVLGDNHLICSIVDEQWWNGASYYNIVGVVVYFREDTNQPFTLIHFFNSSEYGDGFGYNLAMDNGILVVGSQNHTHIFSLQDDGIGFLEEELLDLDQSYRDYQLSGRTLIAASERGLYSMDIKDCTALLQFQHRYHLFQQLPHHVIQLIFVSSVKIWE